MFGNKLKYYFGMTIACLIVLAGIPAFFEDISRPVAFLLCGVGIFLAFAVRKVLYNGVKCKECGAPFAIEEDHRDFLRSSGSFSEKDKDGKVIWYEKKHVRSVL